MNHTPRKFDEKRLLIASKNEGKIIEIQELFTQRSIMGIDIHSAANLPVKEPKEDGTSFQENALIKASYYSKVSHMPVLADDSGLSVEALDGLPGIYSARWAGDKKNFGSAMKRVEKEFLESGSNNYKAAFVCALSLYWPDGHYEIVEGKIEGTITFPPKGDKGFGYDPIFIPNGYDKTFGEMSFAEKQQISHRANAFHDLFDRCFDLVQG